MSTFAPVRLQEAADSMAKASSPEPFSRSKTSNWVARRGGLPPYVQHIAHDIMEKRGLPESRAIAIAIGVVKNPPASWDANAKAAAAKAAAEWEAKKGSSSGGPSLKHSASLSLADRVALRTVARERLDALSEVFGVEGVVALAEAKVGPFQHELKRVASAQSEKERLEIHHEGQHVGTLASRAPYRTGEGDRWGAKGVNGRLIGEMTSSKTAATELLKKHLEDAPARISPSPTAGRYLVGEPQGYSGPTTFKEFPSESAARYEAGLPEKKTKLELESEAAALGEMVVFDVATLVYLQEELPQGLGPLAESSPFDEAKHPRGFHGRFKTGDRVRIMAGEKKGVLTHTITKIEGDKATVKTPDNPSLGGGATKQVPLSDLRAAPGEAVIAAGRKAEADRAAALSRMGFGGPGDKSPVSRRDPAEAAKAIRAETQKELQRIKPTVGRKGDHPSTFSHSGQQRSAARSKAEKTVMARLDAGESPHGKRKRGKATEAALAPVLGSLLEAEAASAAKAPFSEGDQVNYQHSHFGRVKATVAKVTARHVHVTSPDPRVSPAKLTHQQATAKLSTTVAARGT